MAGTIEGGKKAEQSNKERHGQDFYKKIGTMGGSVKTRKGFALMSLEKRSEAGRAGGQKSRRGKKDVTNP
jgi:general stress protein YciG